MFTQEQILEIEQRLRETSAKDTEFPLASLPLEGDEIITVVQGGENKKFPIDLFFESFSQYIDGSERVDFFNVSRYVQITKGYPEVARLTLPEAVENCPEDVRRPGQVITFMDNNDNWVTWQCNGEKKEQWLDTDYWKPLVKPEQEDVLLFDRIITEELPHIGATTNQTPNAIVYASFYKRFLAVVGTGDLATYYYAWPNYKKYTDTTRDNKPYDNKVYLSGGRTYVWDGTDLVAGGGEQIQSDWNQTNSQAKDFIKNKPTIPAPTTIDPTPTKDSPNAVSSGGTFGALQQLNKINTTRSEDGKLYHNFFAGDIYYTEQDTGVRVYWVAFFDGEASEENPVTINALNFYRAENAVDAVRMSLSIKTVSTEQQQSLTPKQQVQAQNNMMGKVYAPAQKSGLGKVYLAKNNGVLTQAMMPIATQEGEEDPGRNTVYVIQYDYTLEANITVPAGCTLEFDGGSISGDGTGKNTITGTATILQADELAIFNAIKIAGTWNVPNIYSKWFADIQLENGIRNLTALSDDSIYNVIHVAPGTYLVSVPERGEAGLILKSNTELILDGTISMMGNAFQSYQVVLCEGVSNVYIHGSGGIVGDLATHDVTQFEYCHGLYFGVGSSNLKASGINISQCPGEGVYIGGRSTTINKNITVENCTISNIGRNGISIDYCDGYRITGNHITNVTINPGAGIFIEPIEQSTHVEKSLNGEIGNNFISGCRHSIRLEHADMTWAEIAAITGETVPAGHEDDFIPLIDNVDIHDNYFDGGISYCVYISNGANIKLRSNYVNRKCLIKKATVFSNTFDFTDDTMTVVFNNLLAYNNQFNCNFPSIDKIPVELGDTTFENNRIVNNGTNRVYSFISIASGYSRVTDNTFEGNARTALYLYGENSDGISMNNKYSPSIGVANPSGNAPFTIGLPIYNAVGTVRPNVHQQYPGLMFFDTTIGKPIYSNSSGWNDAMGNVIP